MLFNRTYSKTQKHILKLVFSLATLCSFVLLVPYSGHSEEKTATNNLPPSPETGTPEDSFEAGGTRDNNQLLTVCGENSQQISYLLGQNNRDYTLDAYPTFWFYIPTNLKNIANLEFTLKNLETGQEIYNHPLEVKKNNGLVGLSIPQAPQYALATNVNYLWSLNIECAENKEDTPLFLSGWVHRLPLNSDLQNQLSATSEQEKYRIYVEEDLYYDALNNLVQLRMSEPNNPGLEKAWNQLLIKLGSQNLIPEDAVSFNLVSP